MVINPDEIWQINVLDVSQISTCLFVQQLLIHGVLVLIQILIQLVSCFNLSRCPATSPPWSLCQLPTLGEGFLMFLAQGGTLVQGQI